MLTCIFCIAMMYMMEFLRDCPTLEKAVPQAAEVRMIVGTGEVVVGIFCVIFLIYSNSFLAKEEKRVRSVPDSRHGEKASGKDPLF